MLDRQPEEQQTDYAGAAAYMKTPYDQDFFTFRLQTDEIISDMYWKLKGKIKLVNNEEIVGNALMNDEGINRTIAIVSSFLNKNIYLGNLNHDEIYTRMRMFWKTFSKVIFINYAKWNLRKEYRAFVRQMVVDTVHSALTRSEEGNEADQLSTASQRLEVRQQDNRPQQSMLNPARILGRRER